jgi:hypothetical protein
VRAICVAIALVELLAGTARAQGVKLPPVYQLKEGETLRAAKLAPSEQEQIFEEIAGISFDLPESWDSELRARRVSLGAAEGLVLQGTHRLCGGTGNCQTIVLRLANTKWIAMFQKQAPIGEGFAFLPESSHGIDNFVVATNDSAESSQYVIYRFDGRFYLPSLCYEKSRLTIKKVACN